MMLRGTSWIVKLSVTNCTRCTRRMASSDTAMWESDANLLIVTKSNGVATLRLNDPKKLNGWTGPMMMALREQFVALAHDDDTKVAVLTGTDPYYCAGVNLGATIKPMHPKKLHNLIRLNNQALFDAFIDFPKPLLVAANGPAIGASVTSATLCDAIIASDQATFNVPFSVLGIPPEGCSSVHFERIMGAENASKMLDDNWKPSAEEACEAGFVAKVVPHDELMGAAQQMAEQWIAEGKVRGLVADGKVEEYKVVNAKESCDLADAFLSTPFLMAQYEFLKSKKKTQPAMVFRTIALLRPLWSKLL